MLVQKKANVVSNSRTGMRTNFQDSVTGEAYKMAAEAIADASRTHVSPKYALPAARKSLERQLKTASYGFNQNPQFEKAFGAIAFTYLQEKAPGLLPYTVGFQLLDRSPEGDRSFGAFVAKIGEQIIDIPMVYRNGELTGHHIMHLRRSDLFLPLREAFIDYLFSQLPQDLGKVGPSPNITSPVRGTPSLQPFAGSRYMKSASEMPHVRAWAHTYELPAAYATMVLNPENLKLGVALKNNTPGVHLDLLRFVSTSRETIKTAAKLCDAYPLFAEKMKKVCGENWLEKACANLPQPTPSSAITPGTGLLLKTAAVTPRQTAELRRLDAKTVYRMRTTSGEKTAAIRVAPATDDYQRMVAEAQRYGDYIEDNRPAEKLAKLYEVQSGDALTVMPAEIDYYKVVISNDKTAKRLIIPAAFRKSKNSAYDLIVDVPGKKWCVSPAAAYAVVANSTETEVVGKKAVDAFSTTRPAKNDVFVVMMPNRNVYGPLLLLEKEQGVWEVDDVSDEFLHDDSRGYDDVPHYTAGGRTCVRKIFISNDNKSTGGLSGDYLTITKGAKFLVLGDAPDGTTWGDEYRKQKDALLPSGQLDFVNFHKYANLHVTVNQGSTVRIGSHTVNRGEARRFLVGKVGVSKEAAAQLLESPGLTRSFVVVPPGVSPTYGTLSKLAYNDYTPDFPTFDEPSSSPSGYYQEDRPQTETSQSTLETPRQPLDRDYVPEAEREVMMSADQQRAMGSPAGDNIFDMIGLVSLLRNGRLDSTVRETTQALLQAINRLGRQILVFEVHDEEFRERYGDANAENIKTAILSTFESVGDLFITLIRQSDSPDPELDIAQLPG